MDAPCLSLRDGERTQGQMPLPLPPVLPTSPAWPDKAASPWRSLCPPHRLLFLLLTIPPVPGHPLSHRLKLFSFPPLSAPQVRTLQSIMNIYASSILLPRLNGENLLGRMGVLG